MTTFDHPQGHAQVEPDSCITIPTPPVEVEGFALTTSDWTTAAAAALLVIAVLYALVIFGAVLAEKGDHAPRHPHPHAAAAHASR